MTTCMDVVSLKKLLEFELSLDERNLCSHAWYHGAITRYNAEDLVEADGHFLIRDCASQPGNFVLTCRTNLQPLHFVINKLIIQQNTIYERVQYHFEDDYFDTIPDLVTSYVASGKPITQLSGTVIQFPVNRLHPLSQYGTKNVQYVTNSHGKSSSPTTPSSTKSYSSGASSDLSQSITQYSRDTLPQPLKQQSFNTLDLNNFGLQEKSNSADGEIKSRLTGTPISNSNASNKKYFSQSLPRKYGGRLSESPSSILLERSTIIDRTPSNHSLCEDILRQGNVTPNKFSLSSSESASCREDLFAYHSGASEPGSSDSGNGSADSTLTTSICGEPCSMEIHRLPSGVIIRNPRYNIGSITESNASLNTFDQFDLDKAERRILQATDVNAFEKSHFSDLENFQTILLPSNENKPLDTQALQGLKIMLRDYGSRTLANHLTKCDYDLIFGKEVCSISGLELCTLPLGHQFRLDIIERTECLKLLVAVSILTCENEDERVDILKRWIEVAIDTKTALGNLYGFCGIMMGLSVPQMQKLGSTWHCLRQRYTDQAFMFEAKLRPSLKHMNNCSNSQAPNTSIPHIIPFALLMESTSDFEDSSYGDSVHHIHQATLSCHCLTKWVGGKLICEELSLSTTFGHLDNIRKCLKNYGTIHRNAEIVLEGARMEEMMIDLFRTEFHKKFLWGSTGALAPFDERHRNMDQILTVLADHYGTD